MKEKVQALKEVINQYTVTTPDELEEFRMRFISRKSEVTDLLGALKDVPNDQKREMGQLLNELKNLAQERFKSLIEQLEQQNSQGEAYDHPDLTLPPANATIGSMHPLTLVRNEICEIFERIGFNVSEGPEIEDDWHNFTALNFPENHPAREMQDTFFIEKSPDIALRTHTSSVQVRIMESQRPQQQRVYHGLRRCCRTDAESEREHHHSRVAGSLP